MITQGYNTCMVISSMVQQLQVLTCHNDIVSVFLKLAVQLFGENAAINCTRHLTVGRERLTGTQDLVGQPDHLLSLLLPQVDTALVEVLGKIGYCQVHQWNVLTNSKKYILYLHIHIVHIYITYMFSSQLTKRVLFSHLFSVLLKAKDKGRSTKDGYQSIN